jgi:hypothetical protein
LEVVRSADRGGVWQYVGPVRGNMSVVEATEVRTLTPLEDRHWWYAERRVLRRRTIGIASGTTALKALDTGAVGGGNTRILHELGIFPVPIEYGEEGAEAARRRGLAVIRATLAT